jgi:chromosome segregation protein
VKLYFANDGSLPIDSEVVSVGRRLYRSGESEYLLNDKVVRLRDIRELLMGTGLASTSYFILEQGKIDRVLSSAPEERRQVFDEAAGISLFKARKKEALRKLERVEENLTRLQDIIDEVEKRVRSLRNQAGRARRYRELSQRLARLRMAHSFRRFRVLVEKAEELTRKREELFALEEERRADLRQRKEQLAVLGRKLQQLDDELGRQRTLMAECNAHHDGTLAAIEGNQRLVGEMEERRSAVLAEASETRLRLEGVLEEKAEAEQALQAAIVTHEEVRGRVRAAEEDLAAAESVVSEMERSLSSLKKDLVDLLQQRSVGQNRSVELSLRRRSRESRGVEIIGRRDEIDGELVRLHELLIHERIETSHEGIGASRSQLVNLERETEETRSDLQEEQANLRGKESRFEVLTDLEARMVGIDEGARAVMLARDASREKLFPGVLGVVASFLKVDLAFAGSLERALGVRAQGLVVTTRDEANRAAEHLLTSKKGYATFFCLDDPQLPPDSATPPDVLTPESAALLLDGEGLPALRLLKGEPDARVRRLLVALLGNLRFVRTAAMAHALRSEARHRGFRFVALDGTVVEPDGSFSAGFGGTRPGLIAQKNEIEILRVEIERLEGEVARLEARRRTLHGEIVPTRETLADHEKSLRELERNVIEARGVLADLDRRARALREERAVEESEEAEIARELEDLARDEAETTGLLARLDREAAEFKARIESEDGALLEKSEDRARIQVSVGEARVRLASLAEKKQSLVTSVQMLDRVIGEEQKRITAHEREESALTGRAAAARIEGEKFHEVLADLARRRDEARAQVAEVEDRRQTAILEREDAERQLTSREDELLRFRDELAGVDVGVGECQAGRTALVDRVREDLAVNLEEEYARYRRRVAATESAATESAEDAPAPTSGALAPTSEGEEAQPASDESEAAGPGKGDSGEEDDPTCLFEDSDEVTLERELGEVREGLDRLGNVNLEALDELKEHEERATFLVDQKKDLVGSRSKLVGVIERIDEESKEKFVETFSEVRAQFNEIFRKLFGGGRADLVLQDEEHPLDSGVDVVARPPGKESVLLSQLSGGERTLTAVAMLFSIFKSRPSPFCLLDEVDAALDDANIQRFVDMLRFYVTDSQFIIVTHSKRTMSTTDSIYGVTMERSGVSKKISVRFSGKDVVMESGEVLSTQEGEEEKRPAASRSRRRTVSEEAGNGSPREVPPAANGHGTEDASEGEASEGTPSAEEASDSTCDPSPSSPGEPGTPRFLRSSSSPSSSSPEEAAAEGTEAAESPSSPASSASSSSPSTA